MMKNDEIITSLQGNQQVLEDIDLTLADGISLEDAYTQARRIVDLISSPDFHGDSGLYDTSDIAYRRNLNGGFTPEELGERLKYTSDKLTIVKDSIQSAAMKMMTIDDEAMMALGGLVSKVTDGEFGKEMYERARDIYEAEMRRAEIAYSNPYDAQTWTAKITNGATNMFGLIGMSLLTGGYGALAYIGIDSYGQGAYNNLAKYARENNGSLDGYELNWSQVAIDVANTAWQVLVESKIGLGRNFLKGVGGTWLRESINGATQEGVQEASSDLAEWLKGNISQDEFLANWENWLVAGAIGGVLQGPLGAATYKGARLKADNAAAETYTKAMNSMYPNADPIKVKKEANAWAKEFNDRQEQGIATDMYQEMIDRVDVNNGRGRLQENFAESVSTVWKAKLGRELNDKELGDIQDMAEDAARESIRTSMVEGMPIADTLVGRIYADGDTLKIRELETRPDAEAHAQEVFGSTKGVNESLAEEGARQEKQTAKMQAFLDKIEPTISRRANITIEDRKALMANRGAEGSYESLVRSSIPNFSYKWLNSYFKAARSKTTTEDFKNWWRNIEQSLNIREIDRFLDKDISNRFAKDFETYIKSGGKTATGDIAKAYDRLSQKMAEAYDMTATRNYKAKISPEIESFLLENEKYAHSVDEKMYNTNEENLSDEQRNRGNPRESAFRLARRGKLEKVSEVVPRDNQRTGSHGIHGMVPSAWIEETLALTNETKNLFAGVGFSTENVIRLKNTVESVGFFRNQISNARESMGDMGQFVYVYDGTDYMDMQLFMSEDGRAGIAVKNDGDIVSVFKFADKKASTPPLMLAAIEAGGNHLDCFDSFLVKYYGELGFAETSRDKWNDEYAPEGWNYEALGRPDIVYMALQQQINRAADRAEAIRQFEEERRVNKSAEEALRVISDKYDTDEVLERKLSKRLRDDFKGDKDEYVREDQVEMQQDAEAAVNSTGGVEYALDILAGKRKSEIRKGAWYNALVNYANENSDATLADKIRATGFVAEATELGREVAALKNYIMDDGFIDGFGAVNLVNAEYSKLSSQERVDYEKESILLDEEISSMDEDINFLDDWMCV